VRYIFSKESDMEKIVELEVQEIEVSEEALVLEEIQVEELAIDGICGVY
jgi:mycofactocin precursor